MMRSLFTKLFRLIQINIWGFRYRAGSALVTVIGFAGVVAVFVSVLSIREGFNATVDRSGLDDVLIVLRSGAVAELGSYLERDWVREIVETSGVAKTEEGLPLASAELMTVVDVRTKNATDAHAALRGVGSEVFLLRKKIRITQGRLFHPGLREIIVGRRAAETLEGLDVGSEIRWGKHTWQIVGHFATDGDIRESEIWTDAGTLQSAYNRTKSYQSVYLKLASASDLDRVVEALTEDTELSVEAELETLYFERQAEGLTTFINWAGAIFSILMGLGAVFGAINTMHSTVESRAQDVATLRAIGFNRNLVFTSVLIEGIVLSLAGGILGGLAALFFFDDYQATTFNGFNQVAFAFSVTPELLAQGLALALALGVIGAVFPAVQAARAPISENLADA